MHYITRNYLLLIIYKSMCSPKKGKKDWCLFQIGHMVYNKFLILDLCPVYLFSIFSQKYDLVVTLGFEKLMVGLDCSDTDLQGHVRCPGVSSPASSSCFSQDQTSYMLEQLNHFPSWESSSFSGGTCSDLPGDQSSPLVDLQLND